MRLNFPLLILSLLIAATARAGELRAGAAAVVITPPPGTPMAGYYFARAAEGVHDDLFAKALVLEKDGTRAALVSLDLISTTRDLVEEARRAIEQATDLPGEAVMISAKRVLRTQQGEKPDLAAFTQAINDYEAAVKATEQAADSAKVGSMFVSSAKSYLTSAKQLMRRVRDKVPYSQGDRMMLNAGSGWMVEGSPQRLLRDYNQLIDAYNRGANI